MKPEKKKQQANGQQGEKGAGDKKAAKKKVSKVDETREKLISISEYIIKYLIKLKRHQYVCQTERMSVKGYCVVQKFYVNEKGQSFSDTE